MHQQENNLEFSAGGLVYKKLGDEFDFVLILNKDNVWTLPKGHIEKDEKPEEAAVREVAEETGIKDLKNEGMIEKIDYFFVFNDKKIHKFVNFYLLQTSHNTALIPQLEEIGDAKWVKAADLLNTLTYKEDVSVVTKAFSLLNI